MISKRHRIHRLLLTGIVATAFLAVAASPASALTRHVFASNLLLQAGGSTNYTNTYLGPFTNVQYVNTQATTSAASCSQLYAASIASLLDSKCGGVGDRVTSGPYNPQGVWYPAVHNHSSHQGRFNASYDN